MNTTKHSLKALIISQKHKKAGRNSSGSITMYHRGGGTRPLLRKIDFKRNLFSIGVVQRIEYDPNRSSKIALVRWIAKRSTQPKARLGIQHHNDTAAVDLSHNEAAGTHLGLEYSRKYNQQTHELDVNAVEIESNSIVVDKMTPRVSDQYNAGAHSESAAFSYILACDQLKTGEVIMNMRLNPALHVVTHEHNTNDLHSTCCGVTQPPLECNYNTTALKLLFKHGLSLEQPETHTHTTNLNDTSYQQHGNNMPLRDIPIGTVIHNIEMCPGQGATLVRAAGTSAQLVQQFDTLSLIRLPSGVDRLLDSRCRATVGIVSNTSHNTRRLSKAGQNRWIGRRPTVRGVAMNPVDHPHGGGEGRTKGGRPSVSPWGKPTKGGFNTVITKKHT